MGLLIIWTAASLLKQPPSSPFQTPENKSADLLPCNLPAVNNGKPNERSRKWSKKVPTIEGGKGKKKGRHTKTVDDQSAIRSQVKISIWEQERKKSPHVLITIFRFPSSLGLNAR